MIGIAKLHEDDIGVHYPAGICELIDPAERLDRRQINKAIVKKNDRTADARTA